MSETEFKQHALSPRISLLYGGIAGSVAKTAVAPFDRVKIHFQIAHPELGHHRGKITGVFSAVQQIYCKSGVLGLYRGHSATLARIFPYAAINFAAFEKFKTMLQTETDSNKLPWYKLIAGSLAGSLAVSITYPFDIIRARISYDLVHGSKLSQYKTNVYKDVIYRLFKEGQLSQFKIPLRGFYQGFMPTILGIIPYAGVSFFTFESFKQYLKHKNENNISQISSIQIFLAGLFAGAFGQTVAYPFDVIRRRMQLFRITDHLPSHQYSSGIFNAIKAIINTHGWSRGAFAGLSINYLKVAPASGISFLVYETLKNKYPDGII